MSIARDLASGSGIEAGEVVPHIIPGVLYPAVAGKDLSGTALGGSYTYGTAHTDGRSYYYTDIKGSKPIKDPRIGAHFGSQRHRFTSHQQLEQETATHGENVYSIDGREWCRMVGPGWVHKYTDYGTHFASNANNKDFIEFTGYFSQVNWIATIWHNSSTSVNVIVDGTSASTSFSPDASVNTPLGTRYVDSGSVQVLPVGTLTLGIHTVKVGLSSTYWYANGLELIAQDTSSTANKSKIQIPSQNVVSYGKKFTVSGTPHYDPFNGFTSGNLAAVQALIDTDTSLGMSNWLSSSTYYRPFNGGRVIKWVDSSGNIKTSVTMMPPNAQNIGTDASNPIDLSSSQTNDDTINFNTSAIENSLSEVAKNFYIREFGNGAANQGNSTSGTLQDFSMANAVDDWAYVMDDGLTSASSTHHRYTGFTEGLHRNSSSGKFYHTFIGTGISRRSGTAHTGAGYHTLAQNLPYGTHILAHILDGTDTSDWFLDGVQIYDNSGGSAVWLNVGESLHIHQPKKPPIPEDAVVLADYMLMADFVPQATAGIQYLSKGTRMCSISRDVFADETDGDTWTLGQNVAYETGWWLYTSGTADSDTSFKLRMPAFATNYSVRGYKMEEDAKLFIGDTDKDSASTRNNDTHGSWSYLTNNEVIGVQNWGVNAVLGQQMYISAFEFATPIHTSSHYQPFETPYLHELVGGDRNMEQHNLIVTPDGKSWDEVTRDTSYIGPATTTITRDGGSVTDAVYIWDYQRGSFNIGGTGSGGGCVFHAGWKGWVYAYDRIICLEDGRYRVDIRAYNNTANSRLRVTINNDNNAHNGVGMRNTSSDDYGMSVFTNTFKRGDYIRCYTYNNISGDTDFLTNMFITRLDS